MMKNKVSMSFIKISSILYFSSLLFILGACQSKYHSFTEKDLDHIEQKVMQKEHSHPNPQADFVVDNIQTDYVELQADKDSELEVLVKCSIYPAGHTKYGESSSMNYRLFLLDYHKEWIIKDSIFGRASDLKNDFRVVDMNGDEINEIIQYTFHNSGGSGLIKKTLIYDLAENRFEKLFHEGAFQGDIIYEESEKAIYRIQAYTKLEDGGTFNPHKYTVKMYSYNGEQFLEKFKLTTKKKYCQFDCENLYTSSKVLNELGLK